MSTRNYAQLVAGLVGGKHHDLYRNSASFHAQVEVMTRMLPIIVDALAVAAEEEEVRAKAMLKIMEATPMPRILVTAEGILGWESLGLENPLVDP